MTDDIARARPEPELAQTQAMRFSFSGSGGEYFRIWIVNLLLSILTLGIYSAWAKVRRTRYFYDSSSVAGASFEYHGNPLAILKGRFVALMLIVIYNLAYKASGIVGLLMLTAVAVAAPWLIWKSLQFKLYNSSYRGIRFGFRGSLKQAYLVYLILPLLSGITLLLAAPFAHQRLKKFQHQESRFGSSHFSFDATVGSFYKRYLVFFLVWLAGFVALAFAFSGTLIGVIMAGGMDRETSSGVGMFAVLLLLFAMYAWTFILLPIVLMLIQNLIWNHTQLGPHRFQCDMRWRRIAFIAVTNLLGIACTFGLFMPFAQIRWLRYRIESMTLIADGSLDHFVAQTQAQVSATGEGMADLLDFDLSL